MWKLTKKEWLRRGQNSMAQELPQLKKMAAGIKLLDAFMK